MAETGLQRKTFFFLIFTGVSATLLLTLPWVEDLLSAYLLSQLGLGVGSEGRLVSVDGSSPGLMMQTTYDLIVNVFHVIKILLWMALVISIVRFFGILLFSTALRRSGPTEIASLLRTVLSIVIYIVAFFIIFQSQFPGVQLAPLFTGSTIIGIVVGLALQDTLGNLFAGIAMQADQPFQVGDVINITNRGTGVVESVSWRGVKIRTFQSKLLIISNAVLGRETIEIAPRGNLNARIVQFSSVFEVSPSKVAQIVRETVRHVENVSNRVRPVVRIRNLGDNGLEWEVKYWIEKYEKYNDTDALIRQRIWYAFEREGISFSFPALSVHVEAARPVVSSDQKASAFAEQLTNVPIFAPLSEEEIEKLSQAAVKRIFAPGEAIVRKGHEGRSMFVIVRGSVKVEVPDLAGQKVINHLGPHDFFGEMSLLTGEPRSATVVAEDEVDVLEIRKGALKPIFETNPDLMTSVCEIIEERKLLLQEQTVEEDTLQPGANRGVLGSIKRFFGIK